jgi:hypothetical protein
VDVKTDETKKVVKRFITLLEGLRWFPSRSENDLKDVRTVWSFMVVSMWCWDKGCCTWDRQWLIWFQFPTGTKGGGNPAFY